MESPLENTESDGAETVVNSNAVVVEGGKFVIFGGGGSLTCVLIFKV